MMYSNPIPTLRATGFLPRLCIRYAGRILAALLFALFTLYVAQGQHKPNIIFILADDMGYNSIGAFGQEKIKTLHLDQMAREGMILTDFYTNPICAPARASFITGKHSGLCIIRDNYELGGFEDEAEFGQMPLPANTVTIGKVLQSAGYTTAIFGKWGLGGPHSSGIPGKQGFDFFYGYLDQKQAHNYYPTHLWRNDTWDSLPNEYFSAHQKLGDKDPNDPASYEDYQGKVYACDTITAEALQFIRNHQKGSLYKGGIRVPFVARWPGKIKAGSSSSYMSAIWDLLPTFAEVAGASFPEDIDGISLLPTLLGKQQQATHPFLYWEIHNPHRGMQAVRFGSWKAVKRGTHMHPDTLPELYNLETDISETNNVAAEHSSLVQQAIQYMNTRELAILQEWNFYDFKKKNAQ